ncbi:MAG: phosphoribosylformylglycinamidine synthase subunit PurQ, partial [Bacteroidales bacterium]|nr:phosphoribosylformylglycinamidine synthase subunit PurQ [Bacteroidales bacterium]
APIDLHLADMFGKPPRTELIDSDIPIVLSDLHADVSRIGDYLKDVLQQEAVACKDWLTNKVDRSVTGRVAMQQTAGEVQLPVNDFGLVALDMSGEHGMATSIGHAPGVAMVDPEAGSRLAVAEALTNLVFAPLSHGLRGVSLSANWMWPARQTGENARLYKAVKAISDIAVQLGINIPTGKDSLSMTQRYPDGSQVLSPGTVIVSALAQTDHVNKAVSAALRPVSDTTLVYIPFTLSPLELGGTALAQSLGATGTSCADLTEAAYFARAFGAVQAAMSQGMIMAGHDVSAGGLVTCLLEMVFPLQGMGIEVDSSDVDTTDILKVLFAERPAVVVQTDKPDVLLDLLENSKVEGCLIARPRFGAKMNWKHREWSGSWDLSQLRQSWMRTSYLLDQRQCLPSLARHRFENVVNQPLGFIFPEGFSGQLDQFGLSHHRSARTGVKAAIIREKGVNGDREMAYALFLAGFDVKDVHMTDLISGRENLQDINFIVFVGGFSNSDVLGSARGWAGAFLHNPMAKQALDDFYSRRDTLSLG